MADQQKLVGRVILWHQRNYGFVRTDTGRTFIAHENYFRPGDERRFNMLVRFTPVPVNEPGKCDRAVDVEVL